MENKKIMLVANDSTFIYKLRKEIVQSFIDKGYEMVLVCKRIKFVSELEEMGCRLIDFNFDRTGTNPLNDLSLINKIKKLLKSERPDLVFTNSIKPNSYFGISCNKLDIPFIPNITGLGRALEYPGTLQKISIKLYRKGMKNANTILFQNTFNRDFFLDHKIMKKDQDYIILPGSGVNINEYEVLSYPKSDNINFLFIGRIRKEKGIDYIINSAKKLHNKYPNIVFNVCGLCEDNDYLKTFEDLEKDGYFKYHGEQKSLRKFYKESFCIVHPTYYPEGMSNVLLEACSHARPIITTNRPGCREIVEDGYNGYMIDIKNQEQLNIAIEKFINLSYEKKVQMGLNGRKKIEDKFDRNLIVKEYMNLAEVILD